jgi:hypothetical protein
MNNTKHKPNKQDGLNQQQHQQQKTRQEQGPKRQGQNSHVPHEVVERQDHEYPETRMTR